METIAALRSTILEAMDEPNDWIAAVALLLSAASVLIAWRSARASKRSADASERSTQISGESLRIQRGMLTASLECRVAGVDIERVPEVRVRFTLTNRSWPEIEMRQKAFLVTANGDTVPFGQSFHGKRIGAWGALPWGSTVRLDRVEGYATEDIQGFGVVDAQERRWEAPPEDVELVREGLRKAREIAAKRD